MVAALSQPLTADPEIRDVVGLTKGIENS